MQNAIHNIAATHSYRAILVPANVQAQDIEDMADANQLPTIRLRAPCATTAEKNAARVSGKQVLRVERVEG